jgi:hypothetical protein
MMDVVYLTRDGENLELRYSLRTLVNVNHANVWVFGGAPYWLNKETVRHELRSNVELSPYRATQQHMKAACLHPDVSDPFTVWNDDFFAMQPVGVIPVMNRGPLGEMVQEFAKIRTPWAQGLREVLDWAGPDALSFDHHQPLIIHKEPMLEALRIVSKFRQTAAHLRTVYGERAGLEGITVPDAKILRRKDPFPEGPWLSSRDSTYRGCVEPILRYMFPTPGKFEQ